MEGGFLIAWATKSLKQTTGCPRLTHHGIRRGAGTERAVGPQRRETRGGTEASPRQQRGVALTQHPARTQRRDARSFEQANQPELPMPYRRSQCGTTLDWFLRWTGSVPRRWECRGAARPWSKP